jgi:hypothetical protein
MVPVYVPLAVSRYDYDKTPHLICTAVPTLNLYHAVYLASATDDWMSSMPELEGGNAKRIDNDKGGKHNNISDRCMHARVRPFVCCFHESPWKERITTMGGTRQRINCILDSTVSQLCRV